MADKAISELVAASLVTAGDLFVLEQGGTAKKLTGQILENWLVSFADGHGGIQSITYSAPTPPSLDGTLTITLADTTEYDVTVTNGKGISSITKTGTAGLVDTYTIAYNNGTSSTFTVTNGAKGEKGDNSYVWIKYSAVNPTSDADMGDIPDAYIGVYAGTSSTAPAHYTSYKWFRMKGDTGDTGATGNGIYDIALTSGTHAPGTLDTYTITYTDGDTDTFDVYNGSDGEGSPGSQNPAALGVASPGIANAYSREDHVHPMPSAANVGAVPTSRTVNGKALSSNVTLKADDIETDSVGVSVQDSLDGKASKSSGVAVAIAVADWSGGTTCTKSVTGVTASNNIVVAPDPSSSDKYGEFGVKATAQGSGTVTFSASATPDSAITVNVLIVG